MLLWFVPKDRPSIKVDQKVPPGFSFAKRSGTCWGVVLSEALHDTTAAIVRYAAVNRF